MKIKFVIEDMWIGLFFKTKQLPQTGAIREYETTYYLCIIPCFPIIWTRKTFRGPHDV